MGILFLIIVFIISYLIWAKNRKPINSKLPNYQELLASHVDFYQQQNARGKLKFEKMLNSFLADTRIEGVGTQISALDRVLIASSAVIPIFGFPEWKYSNLTNIILYPDTFDQEFQFEGGHRNILGMVGSGYLNGQMLLSRTALLKGFSKQHGRENSVLHEFVHLLDDSDGSIDGLPENLLQHRYALPWLHFMHVEMHKIANGKSDINPYALTNEAEFFAVASEYFFEKPAQFELIHPALFNLMCKVFKQDVLV